MNPLPLNKWIPHLKHPLLIAGPCSAESEEQVLETARQLKSQTDVRIFRSGIWKPRTRPNSFEGRGSVALPWLEAVKKETGLLTTVEVANPRHVEDALKHNIDILWIGARTSANPFAVQEVADSLRGVNIPVMVKNPINSDLSLWIGALERVANVGIKKLVAIHRGFSTYEKTKYRNQPQWKIPIELKRRYPNLPMLCDPSHIAGNRELISSVCQKAMDVDMDGVMVETHPTPDEAMSDAAQQVTPARLSEILSDLTYPSSFTADRHFETALEKLRGKIDRIDRELLELLQMRMDVVENIGIEKAKNNITALQINRLDELLKKRMAQAKDHGLREEYVREIFNAIHDEAVKKQTDIRQEHDTGRSKGEKRQREEDENKL